MPATKAPSLYAEYRDEAAALKPIGTLAETIVAREASKQQPGSETVQAQRDLARASQMEAWQEVAELRLGLSKLLKEYIAERDALYDCCTGSDGKYTPGAEGDNDRRAVEEMDAVIDAANKMLGRTRP